MSWLWYQGYGINGCLLADGRAGLDKPWRKEPLQSTSVDALAISLLYVSLHPFQRASVRPSIALQGRSKERSCLAAHSSLWWSRLLETHQLLSVPNTQLRAHTQTRTHSNRNAIFHSITCLRMSPFSYCLPSLPTSQVSPSLETSPTVKGGMASDWSELWHVQKGRSHHARALITPAHRAEVRRPQWPAAVAMKMHLFTENTQVRRACQNGEQA